MTPTAKRRPHRRRNLASRRHGRVRKLSPSSLPLVAGTSSPKSTPQPVHIVDRGIHRRRPKKPWKPAMIPVSSDPLEENILERVPLPDRYIFVAKGDVYITRHCRSRTKETQQTVYAVYNNRGKRILGIRVPANVYAEVLKSAAATAASRASSVQIRDAKDLSRAHAQLRRQFPLMPTESLELILDHAFLKGSGRVGRTSTTTDERKALLAVEAHIRHTHTSYEKLLDTGMDRQEAREAVWSTVQAIKKAWEGGEEQQAEVLALRQS